MGITLMISLIFIQFQGIMISKLMKEIWDLLQEREFKTTGTYMETLQSELLKGEVEIISGELDKFWNQTFIVPKQDR
ncbi:MAG: hypothetical protein EZS28_011016 [Streblomastix strix]|uniref:PWI domain-containing protein n=1 Tax=Streblomastix strix TaxID=222440 RepID=A0A5J4WEU4_9EUKA|nr:MAG: hypothetical protein EZS28_011016 [Streblomastix strix]